MFSDWRSFELGIEWTRHVMTSKTLRLSFEIFREPKGLPVYMVNLNYLLDQVIRSSRLIEKGLKICINSEELFYGRPIIQEYGDGVFFFDSRCIRTVIDIIHSKDLIGGPDVESILSAWEEVVVRFEDKGKGEEGAELIPLQVDNLLAEDRRKRSIEQMLEKGDFPYSVSEEVEEVEDEDEWEREDYEDVQEKFDVVGNKRPMEYEEREHMIRLNCTTLDSLTNAGVYLLSRSTVRHARVLEDIDAAVINVTRELQRFIPVADQQSIQVEDALDDEYAEKAVRVGKRVGELGYSVANVNQDKYRQMLKEVGIRASNLHREAYGRKPKKVRMMSGTGTTAHFNYYSERTAPQTLDKAIREWFLRYDQDENDQDHAERVINNNKKKLRLERPEDEEFEALVQEAENKCLECPQPSYPGSTLCHECGTNKSNVKRSESSESEFEPEPEPEKRRSLFSQFFGNL